MLNLQKATSPSVEALEMSENGLSPRLKTSRMTPPVHLASTFENHRPNRHAKFSGKAGFSAEKKTWRSRWGAEYASEPVRETKPPKKRTTTNRRGIRGLRGKRHQGSAVDRKRCVLCLPPSHSFPVRHPARRVPETPISGDTVAWSWRMANLFLPLEARARRPADPF